MNCDVLIVGAGFAGLVMAERLSSVGKKCIIVEKRAHVGGNAHDEYNTDGVLVHPYGGHLFSTNSDRVFNYLSRFTEWIPAIYTAKSYTQGKLWSFPINLQTYEQLIGHPSTTEDMEKYLAERRVPIAHPQNSEEAIISQVGWELYDMFYRGYVEKMWACSARDLDPSVCLRIPIRITRDDRRLDGKYTCMPKYGYDAMFQRLLAASPLVEVLTGVSYEQFQGSIKHLVYTGCIDRFFNYEYGVLPYRSMRFEHQTYEQDFFQPTVQVNYPNDFDFTRIIEIKHVTGQQCPNTTIVREFPEAFTLGKEPFYPVLSPESTATYAKYKVRADAIPDMTFVGRLATFKYLQMDQVVGMALRAADKLGG
jgi:UDP-galactopyranose mutase